MSAPRCQCGRPMFLALRGHAGNYWQCSAHPLQKVFVPKRGKPIRGTQQLSDRD